MFYEFEKICALNKLRDSNLKNIKIVGNRIKAIKKK